MSDNEVTSKMIKMVAILKDQKKNSKGINLNKVPGLLGLHDRIHRYLDKSKPSNPSVKVTQGNVSQSRSQGLSSSSSQSPKVHAETQEI